MKLGLATHARRWPLREPFAIARETMLDVAVLVVELSDADGRRGRAEAAGVDYAGETPETMAAALAAVADRLDDDLDDARLRALLPCGGARNALDCALLDLRAKQRDLAVWQLLGLAAPKPVVTTATIGIGDAGQTRRRAAALRDWPLLKVKVDAKRPLEPVRIVREEAPSARVVVDANEGWSIDVLERALPGLVEAGVELVEQPLPRDADEALATLASPIPIAADESCTDLASLSRLRGRYQAINIKLDKCGGLHEGLALAAAARRDGLEIMVGNMCGSSLAMAPAFLLAQGARWADLDGPLLQTSDLDPAMRYHAGWVDPPHRALWG